MPSTSNIGQLTDSQLFRLAMKVAKNTQDLDKVEADLRKQRTAARALATRAGLGRAAPRLKRSVRLFRGSSPTGVPA
jgi:hypothetical protein